jgi:hypothetical protein
MFDKIALSASPYAHSFQNIAYLQGKGKNLPQKTENSKAWCFSSIVLDYVASVNEFSKRHLTFGKKAKKRRKDWIRLEFSDNFQLNLVKSYQLKQKYFVWILKNHKNFLAKCITFCYDSPCK